MGMLDYPTTLLIKQLVRTSEPFLLANYSPGINFTVIAKFFASKIQIENEVFFSE